MEHRFALEMVTETVIEYQHQLEMHYQDHIGRLVDQQCCARHHIHHSHLAFQYNHQVDLYLALGR